MFERTEQTAIERLLTIRQAAETLTVCQKTVWTYTTGVVKQKGKVIKVIPPDERIPAVRIGRAVRYDPADLRAWIERSKSTGGHEKSS